MTEQSIVLTNKQTNKQSVALPFSIVNTQNCIKLTGVFCPIYHGRNAPFFVSQEIFVPMKQETLRRNRTASGWKIAALQPQRRRRILQSRILFKL